MKKQPVATHDRRKAYHDPIKTIKTIKSGEKLCALAVFGMIFVASLCFWAGLTA